MRDQLPDTLRHRRRAAINTRRGRARLRTSVERSNVNADISLGIL